ncbi:MAG: putative membrane protein, partial [uncultured Nocardioides sp.]
VRTRPPSPRHARHRPGHGVGDPSRRPVADDGDARLGAGRHVPGGAVRGLPRVRLGPAERGLAGVAHALPVRRRRVPGRVGGLAPAGVVARGGAGADRGDAGRAPYGDRGLVRRARDRRVDGPGDGAAGPRAAAVEADGRDLHGLPAAEPDGQLGGVAHDRRLAPGAARRPRHHRDDAADDVRLPAVGHTADGLVAAPL